jgi:hypothetical protein
MMTHRSKFRPLIIALALTAAAPIVTLPINAQVVPAQTFTAAGTDASPQQSSNCNTGTLQVSGTGTWTIVPIGSNDNGLTYKTITTMNSGSITSAGTFSGAVAGFAASYFSFNVTAVSGSVTIVKSCTSQVLPSSGGGGGGNVVVTNGAGSPVPIYAPSAIPVTGSISANTVFPFPFNTASPQPGATAAGVGVLGLITGTTTVAPLTLSAAGNLLTAINAPLPAGTNAIGSVSVSNFPATPAPYATNASQQLVVAQATAIAVTLPASYQTAFPTPQPFVTDASGLQKVSLWNGANEAYVANPSATANAYLNVPAVNVLAVPCIANGTTCDAWQNLGTAGIPGVQLAAGSASIGKVTAVLPYGMTTGQTAVSGSGAGALGLVTSGGTSSNITGGTVSPIALDQFGDEAATLKKNAVILTTTALGANGVYTSAWFDTTLDNTTTVNAASYSNIASASSGFQIQETNDSSGLTGNFVTTSNTSSAATYTRLTAQITARYWRIVYTNSGTAQTSFEIAYTTSGSPSAVELSMSQGRGSSQGNQLFVSLSTISGAVGQVQPSDGLNIFGGSTYSLVVDSVGSAYNGTTYDRVRKDAYAAGPMWMTTGGSFAVPCGAAANCSVKAGAGRLVSLLVTTVGTTGGIICYDGTSASGTIIGGVTATVGAALDSYAVFNNPAATGIFCVSGTGGPAFTATYY